MSRFVLLPAVFLLFLTGAAHAWWNPDWSYRKAILLDTSATGVRISSATLNVPVLLRLHTGNFAYFADVQADGADLRFFSGDDQTPIPYSIEKFDPANEMALIWLQLPQLQGASDAQRVWMYYGNPDAVPAVSPRYAADDEQLLAYPFSGPDGITDATGHGNHPAAAELSVNPDSLVAAGGILQAGRLMVSATPAMRLNGQDGFTLSSWVRLGRQEQEGPLMQLDDQAGVSLAVMLSGTVLKLQVRFGGEFIETTAQSPIGLDNWHHVALVARPSGATLYLDAQPVANLDRSLADLVWSPALVIGASATADSPGLHLEIDEISLAKVARTEDWIRAARASVPADQNLVLLGADESEEGGGGEASHLLYIAGEVDAAGWIVIVLCAFMALGSGIVIFTKGYQIARIRKASQGFVEQFSASGGVHPGDGAEPDPRFSVYRISPLHHLYVTGLEEVKQRLGSTVGAQASGLSDRSLLAVRSSMDSALVRQLQKLNAMMVLLTISISGGPFLGLLGTVVGIMLTFAAIAASGEVDINSIAPGMAAALLATVAGLAVAIPALFGYNYLATRIKELTADMQVFIEELNGRFTEAYGA